MKITNSKIILPALLLLGVVGLHAQPLPQPPPGFEDMDTNPYLIEGVVEPAPLLPLEFNGTGNVRFDVGNTGSDDIVWVENQAMTMVITLSKGVPDVDDPSDPLDALNALSGPGVAWFSWTYDPDITTFFASQIATIPGGVEGSRERINIAYRVSENSFLSASPTTSNGFNANLQPPDWTNPQPTDDDAVSSYTYVEAFDYGDAPSSYGAPRHAIDLTKEDGRYNRFVYLGTHIDAEDGPQHSSEATGDDVSTDNGLFGVAANDEDGVEFPLMIAGTTVDLPVSYTVWDFDPFGEASTIRIKAWIDWGNNGTFDNPADLVIDYTANSDLENEPDAWVGPRTFTRNFPITIPADATGNYFMRIRIGPNTNPINAATYGEVEDHMFTVLSEAPALKLTKTGGGTDFIRRDDMVPNAGIAYAGQTMTYTFTVENTGPVNLNNVVITDLLLDASGDPVLLTLVDCVTGLPVLDGNDDPVTTTEFDLLLNETKCFTATYVLTQDDIDACIIENTATAANDLASDSDTFTFLLVPAGSLLLEVVVDETDIGTKSADDTVAVTFTVTNRGNISVGGLNVTATGVSGIVRTVPDPIDDDPDDPWTLAPGDEAVFTGVYTLTAENVSKEELTIHSTAQGTHPYQTLIRHRVRTEAVWKIGGGGLPGPTEPDGFGVWLDGYGVPETLRSHGDDASGDGIPNLLKYAFGLDPTVNSRAGLPVVTVEEFAGERYLFLTVVKNPEAFDLEYRIECSGDGLRWVDDPKAVVVVEETESLLRARLAEPVAESPKAFLRAKIILYSVD